MAKPTTKRAHGNVSIYDVANLAGVSLMTVSRVVNNSDKVSVVTTLKVQRAIEQLGYRPNASAKALATSRTSTVGVVIPSMSNNVFTDVVSGIVDTFHGSAYSVQFANTYYDNARELEAIKLFASQRIGGLILAGIDQPPATKKLLKSLGIPIVQIMDVSSKPLDMLVGFSHSDAAGLAANHLIDCGYRHIGFLGAQMDKRTQKRRAGFVKALNASRNTTWCELTTTQSSTVSLGHELLKQLKQQQPALDAVFCNNDDIAIGAYFAAQQLGLRIPQDLGIVGFNDLDMVRVTNPAITSVQTNLRHIGDTSARMLLDKLSGATGGANLIETPVSIQVRGSTQIQNA